MLPMTPRDKSQLFQRAKQYRAQGKPDQAQLDLQRLILADPNIPEAHLELSHVAFDLGDRDACIARLQAAIKLAPQAPALWAFAADRYRHFGMVDASLAAFDKTIALDPKSLRAKVERAQYLQTLGRFDEAESAFRKLLKRHPDDGEMYRTFLGAKTLKKGDPLIRQMRQLYAHPRMGDAGKMHLGFALAKAMEDTGEPSKVFGFLDRANALQRKAAPYHRATRQAEAQACRAAQDGADLTPVGSPGPITPVFVTGMPRSGTTLVEQIIASHSNATAGGELGHALKQAMLVLGKNSALRPLAELTPDDLATWAKRYFTLATRDTGATQGVITDKSIQSHMIFGLIHRGLPGARIIVVQRDPRDIALSMYKNHFKLGTHRYANSLGDIAEAIKDFRASVAYWKGRMPGVLHEVRYDELVADPEPQARGIVAAAGLEWEDACLNFHQRQTAVKTLSVAQVRQPIHAGRRAAWRRYEKEMQPFIEAWGDTPWD
ncbi:MAG: sulfotransferase [Paracoccaceae bacterium]|nr:sulfotransferase [Paracoccaceae bacterium]